MAVRNSTVSVLLSTSLLLLVIACDDFRIDEVYVDNQSEKAVAIRGTSWDGSTWGWTHVPVGQSEVHYGVGGAPEQVEIGNSDCVVVHRFSVERGVWLITIDSSGEAAIRALDTTPSGYVNRENEAYVCPTPGPS